MIDINSIFFGLLTLSAIIIGGFVALKFQAKLKYLIGICAGLLIGTVFLDILPEAMGLNPENLDILMIFVLLSFLVFYILDKVSLLHSHSHEVEEKNHPSRHIGLLSASGILLHTFLDGIIIGTGFLVNNNTGFLIAMAILLHDFTDGISTATIMLRHNQSKRSIYLLLVFGGLLTLVGIILAQQISFLAENIQYLLAIFAGFFLYLGASDLLPEVHKERSSIKLVVSTLIGALTVLIFKFVLN